MQGTQTSHDHYQQKARNGVLEATPIVGFVVGAVRRSRMCGGVVGSIRITGMVTPFLLLLLSVGEIVVQCFGNPREYLFYARVRVGNFEVPNVDLC